MFEPNELYHTYCELATRRARRRGREHRRATRRAARPAARSRGGRPEVRERVARIFLRHCEQRRARRHAIRAQMLHPIRRIGPMTDCAAREFLERRTRRGARASHGRVAMPLTPARRAERPAELARCHPRDASEKNLRPARRARPKSLFDVAFRAAEGDPAREQKFCARFPTDGRPSSLLILTPPLPDPPGRDPARSRSVSSGRPLRPPGPVVPRTRTRGMAPSTTTTTTGGRTDGRRDRAEMPTRPRRSPTAPSRAQLAPSFTKLAW